MNVRRFTARSSRDALVLVRQALGDDAVVLSTKPCADGVEVLAMAPEGMQQIERMAAPAAAAPQGAPASPKSFAARTGARVEPVMAAAAGGVDDDVNQLAMSTLSFQDYVRERMLRRRQAALTEQSRTGSRAATRADTDMAAPAPRAAPAPERASMLEQRMNPAAAVARGRDRAAGREAGRAAERDDDRDGPMSIFGPHLLREPPVLRDAVPMRMGAELPVLADLAPTAAASARQNQDDMMNELRSMKGLIEERFGALAFMEKLNRHPAQARLTQKLLDCGFSPALIRKIGDSLPADIGDENAWAAGVLERNLLTAESDAALEDQGGVYALIGATGVGKTTSTAKIAAAFAAKYGAANLGLITLDAYRIGAHEQLRAYGRILGVPVHTAHDRASLEDLLDLLSAKKMVLIDTAGMAQRDARTRDLLEMLGHRSIRRLLVINAAAQGETIEDVMSAYQAPGCAGIVLSKMDEAVKLGPALDALIRARLKVVGVANGQRVPEDWHRLSANALVHRALRGGGSSAYRLDASDVSLIFTAPLKTAPRHAPGGRSSLHA
jgi:flagellar biosynthesis protein FlhF